MLQEARSSFSDELSRNFPRAQGGRSSNQRRSRNAEQATQMSIICLPPGSQSVPSHAHLLSLTNAGSGYGYPLGSNSSGSINCPINFSSEEELLRHLRGYFGSLSGNNIPCSFYKRTQGQGIRQITFSSFRELLQAVGRGALVIVPDPLTGPCNGQGNTFFLDTSHNQPQNQTPLQTSSLQSLASVINQANPPQVSPYFPQPASLFPRPMAPAGVSPVPLYQPQLLNTLFPGSLTATKSMAHSPQQQYFLLEMVLGILFYSKAFSRPYKVRLDNLWITAKL